MKKNLIITIMVCAAVAMVSCNGLGGGEQKWQAVNDSLVSELNNRDAEIDEMMATFNEITEGFRQINAAEDRVDLQRGMVAEGGADAKERIARDIQFIQRQMQENKDRIAKLQDMLKKSSSQSAEMKKAVAGLNAELEQKTHKIAELQAELMNKNMRIRELTEEVSGLQAMSEDLQTENKAKGETVAKQDEALNKAWFVYGTRKELKEQNILTSAGLFKKDKVMASAAVNKDYFTECDIRTTREIRLYAKSADVLTSHPSGAYTLDKDSKGELTLRISDPEQFWSVSKYLVIRVR